MPSAACTGFEWTASDDSGNGIKVAEGACGDAATKLVAGLAATAMALAATL